MTDSRSANVELELAPTEVARARAFVAATLDEWDLDHLIPEAALLASETVTNAISYGGEPVLLAIEMGDSAIRVAVSDFGPQMPQSDGFPDPRATSGRGIAMVRTLAHDFGVDRIDGIGKTVWFDLAVEPSPS